MKFRNLTLIALASVLALGSVSCKKDENDEPKKNKVTLGAQSNSIFGGFLSVSEKKVYKMADAAQNQEKIDILCFYEEDGGNNIAIAAPGSGIRDIFEGEASPDNWETKNSTLFTKPATDISVAQYDLLEDGDAVIESYFNAEQTSGNKKAKDMKVNDIWAFKTHNNKFGLLKVTKVDQGAAGFVEFEFVVK